MPKAKRLLELMMTVNRKRKFTVKELAEEFGVSTRTILRDLQELSELGVPLYSEVGPHGGYHVFRCDRIKSVAQASSDVKPRDLRHVHLGTVQPVTQAEPMVHVRVELNEEGVRKCETEWWLANHLHHQEDGGGWVDGHFPKRDLPFLAKFFMGLGEDATVRQPPELVHGMRVILSRLMAKYAVVPAGEESKIGEGASDEPSDP
ncbi:WYL domain-containing protein [Laceyella sediminis]|uniref:WYL domain-containing protein n=1 Tax=Laceyella sediminis TaxID=573074 RepID=A0ABX5ENL6_9BACL|nr:WYL domain-containing protein [Laceyella sediminis]PRZ14285.1 WYL domain-containing protein [Laceyella sediminis]